MNSTGAAEANPAAEFGSPQTQFIANHPEQWCVPRTVNGNATPIELECDHDLISFCLAACRLPTDSGDLLFHVVPGWTFCAGAAQVGREPRDFDISERCVRWHHQSRRAVAAADPVQDNLN